MQLIRDIQYALRGMLRRPGLAAVIVLTLAVGIGANTAIFSVVNGVLLKPLPYDAPDRLVFIWDGLDWIGVPRAWVQPAEVVDLREGTTNFAGFAAIRRYGTQLTGAGVPEQVQGGAVTANLFDLLGVVPVLGRTFRPGEDDVNAEPVVVLSHSFWEMRFGGDSTVVGQRITLGGTPTTVVGVLPDHVDFQIHASLGPPTGAHLWTPLQLDLAAQPRGSHYLAVLARLKDGVTPEAAAADLAALSRRLDTEHYGGKGFTFVSAPVLGDLVHDVRSSLLLLLGAVGLVLVIVTANIATILMARAQQREREFALRQSLGASRARLMQQVLTETVVYAVIGGGLGLLLAVVAIDSVIALAPGGLPRADSIGVDFRVLGFALTVALGTGAVCGLLPAFQVSGRTLGATINRAGRAGMRSRTAPRIRQALVASEFALSLMLLVGTGLLIQSFARIQRVDPGFTRDNVVTMRVALPNDDRYQDPDARIAFFHRLLERVEGIPGVRMAGAVSALPLTASTDQRGAYLTEPNPDIPQEPDAFIDYLAATPGYFTAMGISFVTGREFGGEDRQDGPLTVVIDESLARILWPAESPLGRQVYIAGLRTVVGVVRHARQYEVHVDDRPQVYLPHSQMARAQMSLVVRTSTEVASTAAAMRNAVWDIDPNQPVSLVRTMGDVFEDAVAERRFSMTLMIGFGAVALLLASLGLFGVTAYSVSQRVQEFGVRMALGAHARDVFRLVLAESAMVVFIGIGVGLAGALSLARLIASMMFGVSARDPATLLLVTAVLSVVALVAALIPARRATRVDPIVALRHE